MTKKITKNRDKDITLKGYSSSVLTSVRVRNLKGDGSKFSFSQKVKDAVNISFAHVLFSIHLC